MTKTAEYFGSVMAIAVAAILALNAERADAGDIIADWNTVKTPAAPELKKVKVIIPVDGMSSADAFAEQYVAIYMITAPGTASAATLTRTGMMEIQ